MSSINFIQPLHTNDTKKYTYSDLHLDLQQEDLYTKKLGLIKNKSDLKADYNIDAIKNSIYSLFNTKKGQRILSPDYGISLEKYLFEPISNIAAFNIGKDIQAGIAKHEPRITPLNITVNILSTQDGYSVGLLLYISSLSVNTTIDASLDGSGFIVR